MLFHVDREAVIREKRNEMRKMLRIFFMNVQIVIAGFVQLSNIFKM